jgi:hypothetical protein
MKFYNPSFTYQAINPTLVSTSPIIELRPVHYNSLLMGEADTESLSFDQLKYNNVYWCLEGKKVITRSRFR